MSFMGSMLGTLVGRLFLPAAAVGGVGAYKMGALDGMAIPGMATAPSHYQMQARVTSIDNSCRLRFRTDGKLRQTEAMSCSHAIGMLKKPEFANYTLHKSEQVTYSYYSMDGKSTLTGTLSSGRDANGRPYQRNDVINIRVDSGDQSKSQVI